MVRILSEKNHDIIDDAVREAEKSTGAELAVILARASDAYGSVSIACGIVLGCIIALGLWYMRLLTSFPQLMFVQLIACALVLLLPPLRRLALWFAPQRYLKHRAAQRAAAEYVKLSHPLPAFTPVVLIYVSLLERYVHVYASRFVREKIPDAEWDAVVTTLTESVRSDGIAQGIVNAVQHATEMLRTMFPDNGEKHYAPNVIEVIE